MIGQFVIEILNENKKWAVVDYVIGKPRDIINYLWFAWSAQGKNIYRARPIDSTQRGVSPPRKID